MGGVLATVSESLRTIAQGQGVQFSGSGELLPGVPTRAPAAPLDLADGSLDFVVGGSDTWEANGVVELFREWRRCLKEGGRVAVVTEAHGVAVAALQQLLAIEAGLDVQAPEPVGEGLMLIRGVRRTITSLRRLFAGIGQEVGRAERPAAWRNEFWFDLASVLLQAGEGRKAAECFATVLADDADSLEARVGLAMAMALLSDWEESEAILSEVLRTDPKHSLAAEWLRHCRARAAGPGADPTVLTPAVKKPGKGAQG